MWPSPLRSTGVRLLANHRASLDGRQGENQPSHVLQRMEGAMMKVERLLAASAALDLLPVRVSIFHYFF